MDGSADDAQAERKRLKKAKKKREREEGGEKKEKKSSKKEKKAEAAAAAPAAAAAMPVDDGAAAALAASRPAKGSAGNARPQTEAALAAIASGAMTHWRMRLRGLPYTATVEQVCEFLSSKVAATAPMVTVGKKNARRNQRHLSTTLKPGEAAVTLASHAEAVAVLELHKQKIGGRWVDITVEEVSQEIQENRLGNDNEVFIRFLPYLATEHEVRAFFQEIGAIERVKLMVGQEPGTNSGVGFVTFKEAKSALECVTDWDGSGFQGRSLSLCLAKDRLAKDREVKAAKPSMDGSNLRAGVSAGVPVSAEGAAAGGGGAVGGSAFSFAPQAAAPAVAVPDECRTVAIENLPFDCAEKDLKKLFAAANVKSVKLSDDPGRAKAYFESAADVSVACKLNGQDCSGRRIRVRPVVPKVREEAEKVQSFEIFVKYLPKESDEKQVRHLFSDCGEIVGEPTLLRDSQTGKCKGVAWVTFEDEKSIKKALKKDGLEVGSRHISVTVATTTNWNTPTQGSMGLKGTVQAAGTHTPAMFDEILRDLVTEPDGTYVDGTFGRGGHSRGILSKLSKKGRLHAFDMDPEAIEVGKQLEKEDSRFKIHKAPFGTMADVLLPLHVQATGVLLDIGISSPQFDDKSRGFRPEQDGPLDLRFDTSSGQSAWEFLQTVERDELLRILVEYGDGQDPIAARRITDAIVLYRDLERLPRRTRAFATLVQQAKGKEYQQMHPAKLTFQALRIHLNGEFDQLRQGLASSLKVLKGAGRVGVITWKHSECEVLMETFRRNEAARSEYPLMSWWHAEHGGGMPNSGIAPAWGFQMEDAQQPGEKERIANSRSRSAYLHILRKHWGVRVDDLEKRAYGKLGWATPPSRK